MKKTILLMAFLLFAMGMDAQYKVFNFGDLKYETDCFHNAEGFSTIAIDVQSYDMYSIKIAIGSIDSYNSFINRLSEMADKFVEWDSVCIKNGISDIKKELPFTASDKEQPLIFFGENYNFGNLSSVYVRANNKSFMCLITGEVKKLTNRYITTKGGYIVFTSKKDIDDMLDSFNMDKINKYIDTQNEKNNLLK